MLNRPAALPLPDPAPLSLPSRLEARGLSRLKTSSDLQYYVSYGRSYYSDLETCITRALSSEQRDLAHKARKAEQDVRRAELLAR